MIRDDRRVFAESQQDGFGSTSKPNNDDFNFHQPGKPSGSPSKNLHFHDEEVNYKNVDIEKMEAASKHCRACEAKYKYYSIS